MNHKVITIAQQKGGAGKTTIASHLAVAFSQRGRRVALMDTDPQGSLTAWHRIREEKFGKGYTGLTFVNTSGWRVGSEILKVKRSCDLTIIDSPPHTESDAKSVIRAADLVVLPLQPSPTDLWATNKTVELATREKIPFKIVMNRVSANSKLAQTIISEVLEMAPSALLETQLGNRVNFAASLHEGKCVTETMPASPAAMEIKALAEEIWNIVADHEEDDERAEIPSRKFAAVR